METTVAWEWRSKQARIWGLASNWKTTIALGRRPRKGVSQATLHIPSCPYNLISPSPQVSLGGGHDWLSSKIHYLDLLPDSLISWHHCCRLQKSSWPLTLLNFQSVPHFFQHSIRNMIVDYYLSTLFMCHKDSTLVPTWACGCPVQGLHLSSFVARCGCVINCS